MRSKRLLSRYEMVCMGFLCILSPIVRTMPRQQVLNAWDSAWICPLLAGIPFILLLLLTESCFRRADPCDGFTELFIKGLGKTAGTIVAFFFVVWFLFYTAFALRVGADRYVATAYKLSNPLFFTVVILFLASLPVFDSLRSLARTSLIFFPILFVILTVIFSFAGADVKKECIAPLSSADWPAVFRTIPPVTNVIGLSVYYGFLEGRIENKKGRLLAAGIWLLLAVAVIFLICYISLGVFSAQEVTRQNYTFFFMVQSLPRLNSIVRVEPVIIALWVASDFVFISSLLFIINTILRRCFGYSQAETDSTKTTDLKNGRFIIWLIILVVLTLTFFIPKDSNKVNNISMIIIPYLNLLFVFGILPISLAIGRIRKKI